MTVLGADFREPEWETGNSSPQVLRIPGLNPGSPLAQLLRNRVSIHVQPAATAAGLAASALWRWRIRGSPLDWFSGPADPNRNALAAPFILDLHGVQTRPGQRVWRVVDEAGLGLLDPKSRLARLPPSVLSLYLLEADETAGTSLVLGEAHLGTRRSFRSLVNQIAETLPLLIAQAVNNAPEPARCWESRPARTGLRIRDSAKRARGRLRDLLCSDVWAIAHVTEAPGAFIRTRSITADRWLAVPPAKGFVADPFCWPGDENHIVCEQFSNLTGTGAIVMVRWSNGQPSVTRCEFPTGNHLSYPFVFADGARVLCLPEMTAERKQVMYELYRDRPPEPVCTVAEDVTMADATLFRHGAYYWIAYNDSELGMHENLCLRYSEKLEGPWRPHRHNPVKIDVRSSRPGGTLFRIGEQLFRPAQDCSESYGCGLTVHEVTACSPERYSERLVARLFPDPHGPFRHGVHTLCICPSGAWIDGKRIVFDLRVMAQRLIRRLPGPHRGRRADVMELRSVGKARHV